MTKRNRIFATEEIIFLRQNAAKSTLDFLCECLNRTPKNVSRKCYDLGLIINVQPTVWTQEKLSFLKENTHISEEKLAALLGFSLWRIRLKAKALGVKLNNE